MQSLCDSQRIMLVDDVIAELGQLPKTLLDLHAIAYKRIEGSGPSSCALAKRTLKWLLYANRPLQVDEFIAAVSVEPNGSCRGLSSRDVLNVCSNLVVFDAELDIFRFAHLSVREYLETRDDYTAISSNYLIVRRCIAIYITGQSSKPTSASVTRQNQVLQAYAALYWPLHYRAARYRVSGKFDDEMMIFLFDGRCVAPCFKKWMADMRDHSQALEWRNPLKHRLNAALSSEPTPLFVMCSFGLYIPACSRPERLLLDVGGNQKNESGNTALHVAAEYGHVDLVQFLLREGIDIESKGYYRKTVLHYAATAGHESVVRVLLKKAKIDDGQTAFQWAADAGHETLVRLLIQNGANMEAKSLYGKTALLRSVDNGHFDIVRLLLKSGADVNATSNDGSSALHKAAEYGHELLVKVLLLPTFSSQAIQIDAKNSSGSTPLYLAVRAQHEVVVRLLLDAGADVDIFGAYGESALDVAARNGNEVIVLLLLEKRPDLNVKASSGETALECATRMGHHGVVRLLKEYQMIDNANDTCSDLALSDKIRSEATQGKADGQGSPIAVPSGLSGTPLKTSYSPQDFETIKLLNIGTDERHRLMLIC